MYRAGQHPTVVSTIKLTLEALHSYKFLVVSVIHLQTDGNNSDSAEVHQQVY